MSELQTFLRNDCTLSELLEAVQWHYEQLGTVREQAATAYRINTAKNKGKNPPGEGIREFAKAYGITPSALVYQLRSTEDV